MIVTFEKIRMKIWDNFKTKPVQEKIWDDMVALLKFKGKPRLQQLWSFI